MLSVHHMKTFFYKTMTARGKFRKTRFKNKQDKIKWKTQTAFIILFKTLWVFHSPHIPPCDYAEWLHIYNSTSKDFCDTEIWHQKKWDSKEEFTENKEPSIFQAMLCGTHSLIYLTIDELLKSKPFLNRPDWRCWTTSP